MSVYGDDCVCTEGGFVSPVSVGVGVSEPTLPHAVPRGVVDPTRKPRGVQSVREDDDRYATHEFAPSRCARQDGTAAWKDGERAVVVQMTLQRRRWRRDGRRPTPALVGDGRRRHPLPSAANGLLHPGGGHRRRRAGHGNASERVDDGDGVTTGPGGRGLVKLQSG
jgi:hypothetical protein